MPTRALSTAALGMSAQQKKVDNIANNLANVNTTGFKRSSIAFQDLFYQNIEVSKRGHSENEPGRSVARLQMGHGAKPVATVRNFSQGSLMETSNPLNIAINGSGFLQVEMPDGSIAYTRDGNLGLDSSGRVVTQSGLPLADFIEVPENVQGINISKEGLVTATLSGDGGIVDLGQIELAKFVNTSGLSAMGDNLYSRTEASGLPIFGLPASEGFGGLEQGFLEQSNVDIVSEMVNLIQAQRAYETNSKMVQTTEDLMALTNSIKR
ncbi:flagellar basal-body rod protein FlgG [Rhodohalobacter mucosus]|uniref:Flagellar basal-body rod protein FlgG n=1 Tax=Rhodohalobacter mucosus TaxID=2079485 RepID=A0A316TZ04_9BACT|nr:flagellar basal-body rod protein FlgG [Rhodohalobacter mucosus]PWN05196.1 flagellar basal-body rod protein FlgG [Rhodohalobacter mucosus]